MAPASGWRRLLADWTVVGGAEIAGQVLGVVTSLVLRMFLDPAQMGVWQGLKTLLGYANYTNLGASKAAARDYAVALGRGDTTAARRGLDLAHAVNTVTSAAFGLVLVGAGVWMALSGGPLAASWAMGLVIFGLLAVVQRYVTFQITVLRSAQAFAVTSRLAVLDGILTLAICGPATWLWGLPGLCGGTLVVMLASLVLVHVAGAPRLGWTWRADEIVRLVVVGSPILLAGTLTTLFRSLDKWMILAYLPDGEHQLGCYSTGLLVTTQLYGLGNMLAVVLAPRLGEKFGRSGDRRQTALLAARSSELLAAATALPAALAMVAAPSLLAWLLPEYRAGLDPLVWLIPGAIALALALPPTQYLIAVDRQGRALAASLVGTVVVAGANHLALNSGGGLTAVAAATTIGYAVYFVATALLAMWNELDLHQAGRYCAMTALVVLPPLAAALVLRPGDSAAADWSQVVAGSAAVTAVWALCAGLAWRRGGWRNSFPRSAWERTCGRSASSPAAPPPTQSVGEVRSRAERGNEISREDSP